LVLEVQAIQNTESGLINMAKKKEKVFKSKTTKLLRQEKIILFPKSLPI